MFWEDGLRGCCSLVCWGEVCGRGVGFSLRLMVTSSPSPSLELDDIMSGSSTGDPVGVSLSSEVEK